MFEAIEEEDRVIEKEEGLPPALLGSCNDRAKQLHASPSGSLSLSIYLNWLVISFRQVVCHFSFRGEVV